MNLFGRWVILRRADRNAMILENFTLRSALKEANAELRRHRILINELGRGDPEITKAIEKARA
jgi:hypothetical protein